MRWSALMQPATSFIRGLSSAPKPEAPGAAWAEAERLESSSPAEAAAAFARLAEQATNAELGGARIAGAGALPGQSGEERRGDFAADRPAGGGALPARHRCAGPAHRAQRRIDGAGAPERLGARPGARPARASEASGCLITMIRRCRLPQRRFLMRELQQLFPDPAVSQMLAAEDLAARCLEAGPAPSRRTGVARPRRCRAYGNLLVPPRAGGDVASDRRAPGPHAGWCFRHSSCRRM